MTLVYFPKTVAPISLKADVQPFFGPSIFLDSNLSVYLKGGAYVPDIAQNSGVPTALPISLKNLLGSAVDFNWLTTPVSKYVGVPSGGGVPYMDVFWQQGSGYDWELLTGCLYQAEIMYTITTLSTEECTVSSLGLTPGIWYNSRDAANRAKLGVRVTEIGTPPTSAANGYVTISMRSAFDHSVVVTASPIFDVFRV